MDKSLEYPHARLTEALEAEDYKTAWSWAWHLAYRLMLLSLLRDVDFTKS